MKALLMHPDRDFNAAPTLPPQEPELSQDLALGPLLHAMAGDDPFLATVARAALLSSLENDVATIRYRQDVLRDCLAHPDVVRNLYAAAVDGMEAKRNSYFRIFGRFPSSILSGSAELLRTLMRIVGQLRAVADQQAGRFTSDGFTTLFTMLQREFDDEYLATAERHLAALRLRGGALVSAGLGTGNGSADLMLCEAHDETPNWLERMLGKGAPAYTVRIPDRDEAGARALSELRDRGLNRVANVVAQSTDHVVSFFEMLRTELAFYVCCLNLYDRLAAFAAPTCLPQPEAPGSRICHFSGLYDVSLALTAGHRIVGNDVDLDGKSLLIVTGANQGGKSTFLRSVGLAQLMMQAGMFVAADQFTGELCRTLFTHYKREESAAMTEGKLDEELHRLSRIVETLVPDALVLFNESFAATNEREGSEIARQVVSALLEKRVKVVFVTHLYDFAHSVFLEHPGDAFFLRAERLEGGTRTFKLVAGEPLETSYGEDVYRSVFGVSEPERAV